MNIKTTILTVLITSAITFQASAESTLETRTMCFLANRWNDGVENVSASRAYDSRQTVCTRNLCNGLITVNVSSAGNCGFVLYGGTTTDAPILGYGLTDTIDINRIPPALADFLSHYSASKESTPKSSKARAISRSSSTYPLPTVTPVEPFIKTRWGQHTPFNGKCPLSNGIRSVTGCDATAVGQILHYYKAGNFNNFTIEYADESSLEEVSVKFSDCSFDYDKMLEVYEDGKYTAEQADAVAQMMYVTGAACKMQWSSYKSSGQWPLVALDKYFNFKANFYLREAISTDFWMQKIQENLTAGKPILYTGTGVSNSAYSSHIFILDGIDSDNYVHVNWGWDGNSDGYYDITFCHPDNFADNDDGYYMKQMMICDIEPRTAGESYKEKYVATSSTPVLIYNDGRGVDGKVTGVTNNCYESSDYSPRIIYRNIDNPEMVYINEASSERPVFPNWKYLRWGGVLASNDNLPDGKWEVKLQTCNENKSEVANESSIPMRPYFIKKNGKIIEGDYLENPSEPTAVDKSLSFLSLVPLTDVIAKAPFYARIKTVSFLNQAQSGNGKGDADLCFTNVETGKKYTTQSRVKIYDLNYSGLEYEGVVKILPPTNPDNGFTMPAGEYLVTVLQSNSTDTDDDRINYPNPIRITVKEAVDYPILSYDINGTLMLKNWHYGNDYSKKWDSNIAFRINQYYKGIVTSNNNYDSVVMMLYAMEAENPDAEEIMVSAFNFDPQTHFSAYTTEFPGNLYPLEGKYIFYLRYLTPDGERNILPERWENVDRATGLPADPTPHFIQADINSGLPMIVVESFTASGKTIKVETKNISPSQFNGQIIIQGFNMTNGKTLNAFSEAVTLDAGETKEIEIIVQMAIDAVYDVYVKAIGSIVSRGATDAPTLTTKPDGSIAHYQIDASSTGIGSMIIDNENLDIHIKDGIIYVHNLKNSQTIQVYSIDGRLITSTKSNRIEGVDPGVYILNVDSSTFKILVR